jgi:orotidine 5''-phosphate decarboxylase, subfamily 2
MSFVSKLDAVVQKNRSLLCVGLDPTLENLPAGGEIEDRLAEWGKAIVEQTADLVCCYKPNLAFYEQFGLPGLRGLKRILQFIPAEIPVLLDAKRGDIGSTAEAHAKAVFEQWGADAVTLNSYLGEDGVKPFLKYEGKTVFLLCYTSNPSAVEVQLHGEPPMFEHIAALAKSWGSSDQVGLVVGATQPEALARVRQICPQNWILAPGVGAQGGDLGASLRAGLRADGSGLIIPVSRAVMGAPDPRQAARDLCDQIQNFAQQARTNPLRPLSTKEKLAVELSNTGCIKFGSFTLASGKQSPIYIDLRRVVSYPDLFKLVTDIYAGMVKALKFDRIAGVPYAALPTGAVVAWQLQRPFIYPRKEAKTHGTGQMIEGAFEAGQTAVILEDVITSGGSILASVDVLRQAGLLVKDVLVLVDREQGGAAQMAEAGLNLHAALTISEIMNTLKEKALIDTETYRSVRDYLNE